MYELTLCSQNYSTKAFPQNYGSLTMSERTFSMGVSRFKNCLEFSSGKFRRTEGVKTLQNRKVRWIFVLNGPFPRHMADRAVMVVCMDWLNRWHAMWTSAITHFSGNCDFCWAAHGDRHWISSESRQGSWTGKSASAGVYQKWKIAAVLSMFWAALVLDGITPHHGREWNENSDSSTSERVVPIISR